jgi:signal transduction histidine kinase
VTSPVSTSSAAPAVIEGVEWARPGPTAAQRRNDLWLALVLFGATLVSCLLYRVTGIGDDAPFWHQLVWAATMTLPLAFRRVAPELVAIVTSAAIVIGGSTGITEMLFYNICLFIAVYTVGAWGRRRLIALLVRGAIVLAMFAWLFWGLMLASLAPDFLDELPNDGPVSPYVAYSLINVITNVLFFGGAWYFGDAAYRSARSRAALEQRTDELATERERSRDQAVALERLRIARDLHDVVAHHVSVIGVQAGAARRVLARDPDAAATSLSAIEESAREAVAELHGLLGTLRHSGGEADAPVAAPNGLDELPALVDESTASGVPTTLTVVGERRAVSSVVSVTAYRLVQEALTNVRKHAGTGATAEVRVRWTETALEVEVGDTGAARGTGTAATTGAGGLGQIGMRERVAAVGGELEIGPRRHGGYLVRVTLPVRRQEAAA